MNIMVNINLGPDDNVPTTTPAEFLEKLGGDPDKDTISVSISTSYVPSPVPPPTEPA